MSSPSSASPEQPMSPRRLKERLGPPRFFRSSKRPSASTPSPGPSTPRPVAPPPSAVLDIQQGKQIVQAVRTAVDPVLSAFGGMVTKLLDIAELMEENKEECRALAEKLTRADGLLNRADGAKVDGEWVVRLRSAVSETSSWLGDESQRTTVRRIADSPQSQRDINRLNTTLETALGHAHDFFLADAWDRSRTQGSGSGAAQVPSDLPMVKLPPPPQIFFGRDELVKSIVDELLGEQACRIPILGPGGIGKTSVASAVLNNERIETKYGRHRVFVSCEGATSALDIVNTLSAALGVLSQAEPTNALIGYLKSLHCAILLVLDNLETAWDSADQIAVGQLLAHFSSVKQLSLMITMRGQARPTQVKWTASPACQLSTLDDESARKTFIDISGKEEAGLAELLKLLEGLPLAITLMAYQAQHCTPKHLLDAYKEESTRLLNAGAKNRLSSLDVSIRLSLDCFTMRNNPHAQQLLSLISVLPDGLSTADLAHVVPSMANRAEAARILVQVGLATELGHVLRVLAPIRDFILRYFAPQGPHLIELQRYFMQMASRAHGVGSPSGLAAMKALTLRFGNIHAVLMYTWKAWPSISPELELGGATLDFAYFSYLSSYGDCTALLKKVVALLNSADDPHVGVVATSLGHRGTQRAKEDIEAIESVRVQTTLSINGYQRLRAQAMLRLADLYCMQDRYDDALRQLIEAQAAFDEIGDRFGAAQCLRSLGDISHMRAEYDDAVRQLTEAWAAFDEIGNRDGATQCLRSLGDISRMRDQYDNAVRQLTEARAAFDEIGDRLGAAQCLQGLGDISRMQNCNDDAVRQLTEARAAFDEIGHRLGAAQCLQSLGDISRMQNRNNDAVRQLTEARAAFDEIGDRLGTAHCLYILGDISHKHHWYEDAVRQLTEARTVFQAIGHNRDGIARCNEYLGYTFTAQGDVTAARECLQLASRLYTELGRMTEFEGCRRALEQLSARSTTS